MQSRRVHAQVLYNCFLTLISIRFGLETYFIFDSLSLYPKQRKSLPPNQELTGGDSTRHVIV